MNRIIKARSMNELRLTTFVQGGQHWQVLDWIPEEMKYKCQSLDTGWMRKFTCDELLIALMRESWEVHDNGEAYYDCYC